MATTTTDDDDVIKTIPTDNPTKNDDNVVDKSWNRFVWLNLLFYILNSLATYSIQLGWIDLPNNGDLSDKYQTLVTPFGLSFSIWGLIFMWQLVWVVWQLLPSQRNSEGVIKAWYYYPIMTVLQAGWTFSFSNEIMWLALIFMYGILFTLVRASMSLQTYQKTWKGYLLWQAPFSIQTGWIMAASAVMTNTLPVAYDASTTAKIVVGALSLVVLLVTAFTWLSSYPVDFAIPCVIVWALYGVYSELAAPMTSITEEFTTKQINGVRNGVLAAMILIGVGIILKIVYVLAKQRPAARAAAQQEQAPSHTQTNSEKSASEKEDAEETV
mmetsp:Transcript_36891/g.41528  ORF Transcript_36891/g.41528 Transcript_36891/m.41528 type:complete len:326 (+) Transcript_36891:96-1073(+)